MLDVVEDDFLGQVLLGRFKIENLIGAGGMGRVYRARQLSVDRDVAVKILHREALLKRTATQRFLLEAKATSQLTNPHTVTLYDYGETEAGLPFIVMEYLAGRSLKERMLATGKISIPDGLRMMSEVCESLAEAHRRHIVHRDLKPDNIFLAQTDEAPEFVKVLDFGIARAKSVQDVETLTRTGTVAGTPAYVAPEALLGEEVSPAADVYALGLVLFEMFTGYHPFTADTAFKVMRHHLDTVPPSLDRVLEGETLPLGLSALVARCMAKKPLQRPQDAGALRVQLLNIIAGKGFLSESSVSTDTMELREMKGQGFAEGDTDLAVNRPTGDAHPLATNAALERPVEEPPPAVQARPKVAVYVGLAALVVAAVGATVLLQEPSSPEGDLSPRGTTVVEPAASPVVSEEIAAEVAPASALPPKVKPAPAKAEPAKRAPKIETVAVSLSSDPEGAVIQEGDTIHGFTPLVLRLPKGKAAITLTLSKAGYLPSSLDVVPNKGQILETNLKRKAARAERGKRPRAKPTPTPTKPMAQAKKAVAPKVAPKPVPKPKKRIDVLLD
jgi:tRNA A-37 threonylcarbamoyl transferase component Bud32